MNIKNAKLEKNTEKVILLWKGDDEDAVNKQLQKQYRGKLVRKCIPREPWGTIPESSQYPVQQKPSKKNH